MALFDKNISLNDFLPFYGNLCTNGNKIAWKGENYEYSYQVSLQFTCNKRQQEKERPLRNSLALRTLAEKLGLTVLENYADDVLRKKNLGKNSTINIRIF